MDHRNVDVQVSMDVPFGGIWNSSKFAINFGVN